MKFNCLANPNNETRDVVIVTVPWTDSSLPLMAPAQLKPIVESAIATGADQMPIINKVTVIVSPHKDRKRETMLDQ